ncbi:XRE family transcriptional regulator [Magnetospirillum molischianum]|nr:helix-turn-helix domain-containing protein [Magnetospirillum molischianum]
MDNGQWHVRLVRALTRKGWTQSELSARTGIDANNIYKYTSGVVAQPRGDTLRRMADALGVNLIWLRDGSGPELSAVPVVGYVGAGEMFMPAAEAELGELSLDFAAADPIAVVVRGASMAPVYRPGDYLICSRVSNGDLAACLGKDCVVQTSDGLGYIKRVVKGAALGTFTLLSYAADPIPDVTLSWCAPVVWIKRA